MHVLDRKGHGGSPRRSPASRPLHDIPVGLSQRAYFAEMLADLAVKCSVKTANGSALAAAILELFSLGTAISAALLADIH
jgi:pimeloyl-ACP methyl ester carboxylesterase